MNEPHEARESGEPFTIEVRDDLRKKIERDHAKTANAVAMLLVIAVVVALPIHLIAIWSVGGTDDSVTKAFEKWYALVSPLAGAAVGAYYAQRKGS